MKNNLYYLAIAVTLICSMASGQEMIKPVKCIYTADDGRIYINKKLPVYLRLANSPSDNAASVMLTSDSTHKYANPMYFDTEGRNTFYSPWAVDTVSHKMVYPKQNIIFEIYADGIAPKTSLAINAGNLVRKAEAVICKLPVKLVLTSYDATSGTAKTYISINGRPFEEYISPIVINDKGEYQIKFYSVDRVGNVENPREQKVKVN